MGDTLEIFEPINHLQTMDAGHSNITGPINRSN